MAAIPVPEASVSNINDLEKSGKANTGVVERAIFNVEKACCACVDQAKLSFLNKSVNETASNAKR